MNQWDIQLKFKKWSAPRIVRIMSTCQPPSRMHLAFQRANLLNGRLKTKTHCGYYVVENNLPESLAKETAVRLTHMRRRGRGGGIHEKGSCASLISLKQSGVASPAPAGSLPPHSRGSRTPFSAIFWSFSSKKGRISPVFSIFYASKRSKNAPKK